MKAISEDPVFWRAALIELGVTVLILLIIAALGWTAWNDVRIGDVVEMLRSG